MQWVSRVVAIAGIGIVAWVLVTSLPAVIHGHPAYAVALVLTLVGCAWVLLRNREPREPTSGWRRVWVASSRPFAAVEPALAAMDSDGVVTVSESPTRIVMAPTGATSPVGVFFQPGAKVEARAYAAVLRPLAESGHRVVIAKQPFGIGFFATGAFESVRAATPEVTGWVVGGHSLGGTVAAFEARDHGPAVDPDRPVVGLLLHASYPAGDLSDMADVGVLSVSGTRDGLATPDDIEASQANLPADAQFEAVDGAVHSSFGDYGPQPGDGEPIISQDEARTRISNASGGFVAGVAAGTAAP
jgi:hypothetical protein